ncbi:Na+/H+ antiporter subunit E [Sphingobium sp. D43FB]|nr:Na+/H+ antiporter subunit E [Sphingobium sp. D43FB]
MRRLLPFPFLAASLLIMWLLLMQSVSLGQVLLGALVALVATWSMTRVRPVTSRITKWGKVMRLLAIVVMDVTRSNLAVARIVLSPGARQHSSFLHIPLQLKSPNALACLALIITATPGSAWVQFDRGSGMLLIHVFDLVDEDDWIRLLKSRYEALLMEIFEP